MATTITSSVIIAGLADAIVAEVEANQASIVGLIGAGEADATAMITNLLKDIPVAKGVPGVVLAPIETAIESAVSKYAATLVSTYGPSVVYSVLLAYLKAQAAKLGG